MSERPTLPELVGLVLLDGIDEPRDPVRQIAAAERLAAELDALGDRLVGFFVELARAEGCSWTEIGAPRGLSRQGAQQRYGPLIAQLSIDDLSRSGVLERFSTGALDCLRRAQASAAELGHDAVDSGDLLAALLADPAGLAGTVIGALGVDPAAVRAALGPAPGEGSPAGPSRPPIGPDLRRAIDGAAAEAHGHDVDVAHLLLGLLRTPGSRAGRALAAQGITRPAVLARLIGLVGRSGGGPA